jgi:valyl-tRNA synthetase
MKGLAEPAKKAAREENINIIPTTLEKVYYHCMENGDVWRLSRRLGFGHQCPAYFVHVKGEGEGKATDHTDSDRRVAGRTEGETHKKAAAKFPGKQMTLERVPNVLDTWFSTRLWPFSTLG